MKENRKLLREVLKDIRHDMTDEEVLNLLADSKISVRPESGKEKYTLGQRAADTIRKGADTFEPAFRLLHFQSNLEITFRCFCDPSVYHKFISFPFIPSYPSPCSCKHYTCSCTGGCKIQHSVCLQQRILCSACTGGSDFAVG